MIAVRIVALVILLFVPVVSISMWAGDAENRLEEIEAAKKAEPVKVAVASAANEQYCTGDLKRVLRRVLQSCGLLGAGGNARGCQPADAKNVATMAGGDFNALFRPMKARGGIVQYEKGEAILDNDSLNLIDNVFADQRGASYFFVVSRASTDGKTEFNRDLSKQRAESVMSHLRRRFNDPDLDKEVGLLWLGEEFAQLDEEFCDWRRSRAGECEPKDLNRSAFIAWIDCTL